MPRYSKDPRFTNARFDSKCAETGRTIKKGERIAYYPNGNKVYCEESKQAQELTAWLQDQAMGHEY